MKQYNAIKAKYPDALLLFRVGDFYEFTYLPDSGIHVLKNSTYVDTIPGIDFKKAFFGIFLSSNPVQKSLKKAMLGG